MTLRKAIFFVSIYFLSFHFVYSQDVNTQDSSIISTYEKELKLDENQLKEFLAILQQYTPQLQKKGLAVSDYNTILKEETLEIYNMLTTEQFSIYKKLKESIEPSKKYRFENN